MWWCESRQQEWIYDQKCISCWLNNYIVLDLCYPVLSLEQSKDILICSLSMMLEKSLKFSLLSTATTLMHFMMYQYWYENITWEFVINSASASLDSNKQEV